MYLDPGLYAEGLLAAARGEYTVESRAAATRLAHAFLLLEHTLAKKEYRG